MRKAINGLQRVFLGVSAGAVVALVVLGVGIAAVQAAPHWRGFLTVVAAIAVGGLVLSLLAKAAGSPLPRRFLLDLDLRDGITDAHKDDVLAKVTGVAALSLRDVLEAFERAEKDKRVVGVIARIGGAVGGAAHVQEVRDAVASFRATGKPTTVFSVSFGEGGNGTGAYYLASAFGEIVLQPSGDVGVNGLLAVAPFVRGTLDKLGIVYRGDRRHEYKNAANMLTERSFTPPHREATGRIVESTFELIVAGIAADRRLTPEQVRAAIDGAPLLGQEAVQAGLVDRLGYWDEAVSALEAAVGVGELERIPVATYKKKATRRRRGATVALIAGHGAVVAGNPRPSFPPGPKFSGDVVSAAFRSAVKDKRVKAILFRVDSPGGSYIGSDQVWREVGRAREAGKPVIVTMGNVAASGGYFVAMAADKIVAQPATLTGSIGVLGGKPLLSGFHEKIGYSTDAVHAGANAKIWTTTSDFTASEWNRFQMYLDRVYNDFTAKVARGRGLPVERVHEIAKGRVWTGADAVGIGLVDRLGGYREALALVREAAGIKPDAPVQLKLFPKKRGVLTRLRPPKDPDAGVAATSAAANAATSAMLEHAVTAGADMARSLVAPHGVLSMPDDLRLGW